MTSNGGDDSDPEGGSSSFREEVGPAEPPPVTDAMITPRTSPGVDPVATEGDTCRVCGEPNRPGATYCLACGVRLTDPPQTEPLDWIDDDSPPEFDHGVGLMDLEEATVTPLHDPHTATRDGADQPAPSEPRDRRRTIKITLGWIIALAALVLLFTTFRGNGEDATPTVTTIVVDHTELESYGAEIAAVAARLAELTERGTAINTAWDDRTEEFQTTLTALRALESQAAALPDLVSDLTAPEVIGVPTHQRLVNSAQTFANAASEMVDGLRAPDTGDARRAALKKFEAAAVEFATLTGGVEQAVGSLSDLSTD